MLDYRTILVGAGALVVLYLLAKREAAAAVDALSPINRGNVVNQAFNSLTRELTDDDRSLGMRFSDHCIAKAIEKGGRIPEDLPWYCPEP